MAKDDPALVQNSVSPKMPKLREGGRIQVCVLLPEEYGRSVTLLVDPRMPVLDLLVYISSLYQFNPSSYALAASDETNERIVPLSPSQCVGEIGSDKLKIISKRASNTGWRKNIDFPQNMSLNPDYTLQSPNTYEAVQIVLPDGRKLLIKADANMNVLDLFHSLCLDHNIDPAEYTFRTCDESSLKMSTLADLSNQTLEMVPVVAESEASVDGMCRSLQKATEKNRPHTMSINSSQPIIDFTKSAHLKFHTLDGIKNPTANKKPECSTLSYTTVNDYLTLNERTRFHKRPAPLPSLALVHNDTLKSRKKRRAPLPPEIIYSDSVPSYCLRERSFSGSSKSTMDDISEDFKQAIQLGRTTLVKSDKGAQTNLEFETQGPHHISQEVQACDTENMRKEYGDNYTAVNETTKGSVVSNHEEKKSLKETKSNGWLQISDRADTFDRRSCVSDKSKTPMTQPLQVVRSMKSASNPVCSDANEQTEGNTLDVTINNTDNQPSKDYMIKCQVIDPCDNREDSGYLIEIRRRKDLPAPAMVDRAVEPLPFSDIVEAQSADPKAIDNSVQKDLINKKLISTEGLDEKKDIPVENLCSIIKDMQENSDLFHTMAARAGETCADETTINKTEDFSEGKKKKGTFNPKRFYKMLKDKNKTEEGTSETKGYENISEIIGSHEFLNEDVSDACNIQTIIAEHDSITSSLKSLDDLKRPPMTLEVTEKTTTVKCTVTVEAEGHSISARARLCHPEVLTPRPYAKTTQKTLKRFGPSISAKT